MLQSLEGKRDAKGAEIKKIEGKINANLLNSPLSSIN